MRKTTRDQPWSPLPRLPEASGVTLAGHFIDRDDPAYGEILREIARLTVRLGLTDDEAWTADESAVVLGIKLGRARYERLKEQLPDASGDERYEELSQRLEQTDREKSEEQAISIGSVVYYIRRGAMVKIGSTIRLRDRMRELLPEEILAVEPGGRLRESAVQRRLKRHLIPGNGHREWFWLAREVQEHIEAVREEHGLPLEGLPVLPAY